MKKVVIFGATSGIGRALVSMFVKTGYTVAITGRRLEKLEEIKAEAPDKILIKQNDIQQTEEVEHVFNEIVTVFGTIDIVVQSSGVGYVNSELLWEKEEETMLTNVVGCTKLYDLAYNLFRKQGFGHLVGISSIASLRGNRAAPAYFASKAYQKSYLESLYIKTKTIKSRQVFITDVRPGFVDTAMALGDGIFWLVPLEKATKQIFKAIQKKKKVVYVSKRWRIIAIALQMIPRWLLKKVI